MLVPSRNTAAFIGTQPSRGEESDLGEDEEVLGCKAEGGEGLT
jgi:hypothetical protein